MLFGKDAWAPSECLYLWRTFDTADEYFEYYRDYHAFWRIYGMDLPDPLLRKLYHANALTVIPGLNPFRVLQPRRAHVSAERMGSVLAK